MNKTFVYLLKEYIKTDNTYFAIGLYSTRQKAINAAKKLSHYKTTEYLILSIILDEKAINLNDKEGHLCDFFFFDNTEKKYELVRSSTKHI